MTDETLTIVLLEPKSVVAQVNRKSVRARTQTGPVCPEGKSGSHRSRARFPTMCCQSTLSLGHVPDSHLTLQFVTKLVSVLSADKNHIVDAICAAESDVQLSTTDLGTRR